MTKKIIRVVAAAIIQDGKIFCAQRPEGKDLAGFWEFPGGKIEAHEAPEEALKREIREEFGADIEVLDYINEASFDYAFGTVVMKTYYARLIQGPLTLLEHQDSTWLEPQSLHTLEWAPVDRAAVEIVREAQLD
ncbi:(deoxy)nucleoside triphosphate pyrophosphohydrolase [Alloscardovia criceti]|uniref:(deoxy)nucleoside triphosphate pyrophosphohydrolase n=1 Tax=Alloscardovia criceti TaxID=356828 RepID=UPI0003658C0C|nr:(deoxy)nucleoside triphosphate pyrophosphohydrolase [Alloscardovia criceti]